MIRYLICWAVIVILTLGMVNIVALVGKPREPVTRTEAVLVVIVQLAFVAAMVYLLRTFP